MSSEEEYEDDFEATNTIFVDDVKEIITTKDSLTRPKKIKSDLDRHDDVKFAFGSVGFQHIRDLENGSVRETSEFKDPQTEFSRFEHISSPYDLQKKSRHKDRIESQIKREKISKYDFVPCASLHSLRGNERYEESPYNALRKAKQKERQSRQEKIRSGAFNTSISVNKATKLRGVADDMIKSLENQIKKDWGPVHRYRISYSDKRIRVAFRLSADDAIHRSRRVLCAYFDTFIKSSMIARSFHLRKSTDVWCANGKGGELDVCVFELLVPW